MTSWIAVVRLPLVFVSKENCCVTAATIVVTAGTNFQKHVVSLLIDWFIDFTLQLLYFYAIVNSLCSSEFWAELINEICPSLAINKRHGTYSESLFWFTKKTCTSAIWKNGFRLIYATGPILVCPIHTHGIGWSDYTRSSATAEKQRVSCPHGGGGL